MDRRRRPFAAVSTSFASSDTFDLLFRELGDGGPLAFLLLVLAAKRAPVQGTIEYSHEEDFWRTLCYPPSPGRPDLETFITLTGRMKQTRRSPTRDRQKTITLTNFQAWQRLPRTWADAARKRASRHGIDESDTADNTADDSADDSADVARSIERKRGEETTSKSYGYPTSVEPDTTPSAANPNGSAPGSPPAEPPHPQPGQTPADYVTHHGWALPEGRLATVLIDNYPDLDDPAILELLKHAGELQREHETEAEILF